MSEAAERVEAWRRAKRQAGYRPVMLWLPIAVKSDLDALAYTRGQDISACVEDAIHALASSQGSRKPLRLDTQQLHQLKDEIAAYVMGRLSEPGTPSPADAPQEPSPPAERPRRAKTGGKPALAPETLAAICDECRKYPGLSLAKLAKHLYDTGIYRATSRAGQPVPVNPGTLKVWLDNAKYQGLP